MQKTGIVAPERGDEPELPCFFAVRFELLAAK